MFMKVENKKVVLGMKLASTIKPFDEIILTVVPDDFINHSANKDPHTHSISAAEQDLRLGIMKIVGKGKTYRIVREYSSYSRKKGNVQKRHILAKGFPSHQAACDFILYKYPQAIIKGSKAINVGGSLYPDTYYIQ